MADAKTWTKRVAAWRSSGTTASEFSTGRGFAPSTLRWWASRLRRRDSGFVRLVAAAEPPLRKADSAIELELDDVRVRVRVSAGFDRTTLGQVLEVLRGGRPS